MFPFLCFSLPTALDDLSEILTKHDFAKHYERYPKEKVATKQNKPHPSLTLLLTMLLLLLLWIWSFVCSLLLSFILRCLFVGVGVGL